MEKIPAHRLISEQLGGLGFKEIQVKEALKSVGKEIENYSDDDLLALSSELRKRRMKMLIAANKADKAPDELIKRMLSLEEIVVPTSAEVELTLRTASKNGFIRYYPGDKDFEILKELNEKQLKALNLIRNFLRKNGGTGVQEALNRIVFDLLEYVVVYPVEDENKYTDTKGNVLPDALLVKKGTTARELAFLIHTEIGKHFVHAIDARKKMRIADDYEIKHNDVIKIVSSA